MELNLVFLAKIDPNTNFILKELKQGRFFIKEFKSKDYVCCCERHIEKILIKKYNEYYDYIEIDIQDTRFEPCKIYFRIDNEHTKENVKIALKQKLREQEKDLKKFENFLTLNAKEA